MMAEHFDVVVVGGGFAGLVAAKTYLQCSPQTNLLVMDSNETVGGTWSHERVWDGLRTNNLLGTLEYPDFPFDEKFGIKKDQYMSGAKVHDYLNAYVDHFGFRDKIRQSTKVTCATKVTDLPNVSWRLDAQFIENGDTYVVECEKLIVATGLTSQPLAFCAKGQEQFDAPIFIFKDLAKTLPQLRETKEQKKITVLGGSKSSYDSVYMLANAGFHVNWIIRKSGYGPTWMLPSYINIGPLRCWIEKLTTRRLLGWFSPTIWPGSGAFSWIQALLHRTSLGRALVDTFWWKMTTDSIEQSGLNSHPALSPLKPDGSAMWYATSVAILNYPTNFHDLVTTKKVTIHRQDLSHLSHHTVHLADGTALFSPAGLVTVGWEHEPNLRFEPTTIHADLGIPSAHYTAGQSEFWSQLDAKADAVIFSKLPRLTHLPIAAPHPVAAETDSQRTERQFRLYRFHAPPGPASRGERNLVFQGFCAHLIGTAVGNHVAALWNYAYLNDLLEPAAMPTEDPLEVSWRTALAARFVRVRFPWGNGAKFPDFVFEQISWLDVLLGDLGLSGFRKRGVLEEVFSAYGPEDYRTVVEEWIGRKGLGGKKVVE